MTLGLPDHMNKGRKKKIEKQEGKKAKEER